MGKQRSKGSSVRAGLDEKRALERNSALGQCPRNQCLGEDRRGVPIDQWLGVGGAGREGKGKQ